MEPLYLDDETLTSNLDDEKAQRIIKWLRIVYVKAPQDLEHTIFLVRIINDLFGPKTEDEKIKCLLELDQKKVASFCTCEVNDTDIFERIMVALEDKYA